MVVENKLGEINMIPIFVYLIIIVVEAIIIAVVIHKGIRQVERANYWKKNYILLNNSFNEYKKINKTK